jgi:hypothetical protein
MISVDSGGAAERMAARIFSRTPRAGSGTAARYPATVFGWALLFLFFFFFFFWGVEARVLDLLFFIRGDGIGNSGAKSMHAARVMGHLDFHSPKIVSLLEIVSGLSC